MPRLPETGSRRFDFSAVVMPTIVFVLLSLLVLRLWYLQVVKGEILAQLAYQSRSINAYIPAPRGQIMDRDGGLIAGVSPSLCVIVTPDDMLIPATKKKKIIDENLLRRLANLIEEDPKELKKDIEAHLYIKFLPFVAKTGITLEQAIRLEEQRAFLPGVFVRSLPKRLYPGEKDFAHAVGYVSGLSQADIARIREAKRVSLPQFTGAAGIERRYDLQLMGTDERESVEITRGGKPLTEVRTQTASPGDRLRLTLDSDLQKAATDALRGRRGAAVAIQPSTGEILCLVSSPAYDPNLFVDRSNRGAINRILGDKQNTPMFNRAVSGTFAPGSTFKMITLIAGIRAGIVSPTTTFVCDGRFEMGRQVFRCLGVHGRIKYEQPKIHSCNSYFANVSSRLTRKQLVDVAMQFGLGAQTGVDLVGEGTGALPISPDNDKGWHLGDTVNLGVGQGKCAATPLQMANFAAILANRGIGYKPHLVQWISPYVRPDSAIKISPEQNNEIMLEDQWWDMITRAMTGVVNSGTATAARISGYSFAGKTGSAEQRRGDRTHAWFIGFAPAQQPEIAIAVVLEAAGHGGAEAAPVARQIVQTYLRNIDKN